MASESRKGVASSRTITSFGAQGNTPSPGGGICEKARFFLSRRYRDHFNEEVSVGKQAWTRAPRQNESLAAWDRQLRACESLRVQEDCVLPAGAVLFC